MVPHRSHDCRPPRPEPGSRPGPQVRARKRSPLGEASFASRRAKTVAQRGGAPQRGLEAGGRPWHLSPTMSRPRRADLLHTARSGCGKRVQICGRARQRRTRCPTTQTPSSYRCDHPHSCRKSPNIDEHLSLLLEWPVAREVGVGVSGLAVEEWRPDRGSRCRDATDLRRGDWVSRWSRPPGG